jgi:hypothetical protein
MAKVAHRVNAVVVRAVALAPTRSLENNYAAT